jgi:hypothetical protein
VTTPKLAKHVPGKGRMYVHPVTGDTVPSVTNCIGVLDKPAIPRWAAKMVAEQAWKMRRSLDAMGQDECIDVLKGSPWRSSGRSADRGTSVHDYLQAIAEGRTPQALEGDAARYKPAADAFLADFHPEFVLTEFTVFGDGYAGTADFLAYIDGDLVVGDYKTSKRLYREVALQLAAIRYAETVVSDEGGQPMPKVDGCVGVLLTPDGYEVVPTQDDLAAHRAFLACVESWRWLKGDGPLGKPLAPPVEVAS